jgi:hypothetical protein
MYSVKIIIQHQKVPLSSTLDTWLHFIASNVKNIRIHIHTMEFQPQPLGY